MATTYTISGKLTQSDGTPLSSAVVKVLKKNLKTEEGLGLFQTGNDGAYTINFDSETAPDVIVRAYISNKEIASSGPYFGIQKKKTVNLIKDNKIYLGTTQIKLYSGKLTEKLEGNKISSLSEDELKILSGKTKISLTKITLLKDSESLSQKCGISKEFFYGLINSGMKADLYNLAIQPDKILSGAIKKSADKNLIPESEADDSVIASNISKLRTAAAKQTLTQNDLHTSMYWMLRATPLSQKAKEKFLVTLYKNSNNYNKTFDELKNDKNFKSKDKLDKVKAVFEIGSLTGNFYGIVKSLKEKINNSTPLSSFSVYTKSDWVKFIKDNKTSIPSATEGKNLTEKRNNYAEMLTRNFEKAFPGEKVKGKILADNPEDDLKKFFEIAHDFDIGKTQIHTYLKRNENSIKQKVRDFDKLSNELKQFQRLYRITPDEDKYEKIKVLKQNNEDSGSGVVKKYTKTGFVKQYKAKLGKEVSETIYKNAQGITSTATAVAGLVADKVKGVSPWVIGKVTKSDGEIEVPDWQTLFGSTSYCECKECRSVLSPAAYLVDILEFINRDANADGKTPKDILFERRPDIGNILLSCENTNTALPYIDLVNEILEIAVLILNGATTDSTFSKLIYDGTEIDIRYQTTGTTQELQAMPEHTIEDTYDNILNNAVYPFGLPFLLWNKEGDVYFEKLGIQRHELLRTLQYNSGTNEPKNISIALVHLGISENEKKVIAGEKTIGSNTFNVNDFCGISSSGWESKLSNVDTFLEKMDITYDELLELQQVKFVSLGNNFEIDFGDDDSSNCDITQATLKDEKGLTLTESFFEKVHRFLRLRKKLGWNILDLNKTINALGETDFTEKFFIKLSNVKYFKEELKIDLVELLSWWSNINTDTDANDSESRSFYEQLFLNKAVINPIPEGYIFTLSDDKTKLLDETGIITDYSSAIASALNISSSDLSLLVDSLSTTTLTLSSLSELHRKASAAKAFDVEVKEMLVLIDNLLVSPFDNSDLNPVKFFEYVTQIKDSEFSILQLDYLFRHNFESADGVAPTETAIGYILQDIQEAIRKIKSENTYLSDTTGEVTQTKLQQILDEETTDAIIDIILERSSLDDAGKELKIKEALPFLDQTVAKEKLITIDTTITSHQRIQNRYSYLLPELLKYIIKVQSIDLISQLLSDSLSIDLDTSKLLVTELVISPKDSSKFAIDVLTDTAFTDYTYADEEEISKSLFPDQYDIYFLIDKSVQVLTGFGFNNEEVVWIYKNSSKTMWLDLNKLTLTEDLTITGLFKPWLLMFEFSIINSKYRTDDLTMTDILEKALNDSAATVDIVKEDLISLAGWENTELLGTALYNVTNPKSLGDAQAIYKLYEINQLIETAGVSASILMQWISADLSADQSKSITEAVKAKYNTSDWLNVAPGLRNKLRPLQRDAMLSYIVAHNNLNLEDENDVIDHYLIDVKMEFEFLTARIKQACSSVQMFILRSFMGLETDVSLADEEMKEQWEWMKYYRYWEANRKVFLWPENYLEPELRTTKSEIFEELESELLQDEINEENVERAFTLFIEKLDNLSNIEVMTSYHYKYELSDEETDVLHVVGRTKEYPHEYFYRKLQNSVWTPWEKINVEIDSEHLVITILNNRLFLFWISFLEETQNAQSLIDEYELQETLSDIAKSKGYQKYDDELKDWVGDYEAYVDKALTEPFVSYKMQIAVSEYKYEKWQAKKVSKDFLNSELIVSMFSYLNKFSFTKISDFCFYQTDNGEEKVSITAYQKVHFESTDGTVYEFRYTLGGFEYDLVSKELIVNENLGRYDFWGSLLGLVFIPDNEKDIKLPIETEQYYNSFKSTDESTDLLLYYERSQNNYQSLPILKRVQSKTPDEFVIPIPVQYDDFYAQDSFFFSDYHRVYYVEPQKTYIGRIGYSVFENQLETDYSIEMNFKFTNFYHPTTSKILYYNSKSGISSFMNRTFQLQEDEDVDDFFNTYSPENVTKPYPDRYMDFSFGSSFGNYNWELFYHSIILLTDYLNQEQRFEEAQKWYHYIFNPTDSSSEPSPQKFWQLKPFFEEQQIDDIYDLLYSLSTGDSEVKAQITAWKSNSFEPHKIAELRIEAYMKNTLMKYLDNLLAWGDSLFSIDTIETINEATQIYILGLKILGDRPVEIPSKETEDYSYNDLLDLSLSGKSDSFSNFLIPEIETYILNLPFGIEIDIKWIASQYLYFCIPYNTNLLNYWDDFEDRLFKIRNSMNLEGVTRSLALYEPSIDPALLVNAKASGVDLGQIFSDTLSPLPNYRFRFFIQKATQFCNDVQSLGGALLSALEKKDAEELSLLRGSHELKLLQTTKDLKKQQLTESEEAYDALVKSKELAEIRYEYYKNIEKTSSKEKLYRTLLTAASILQAGAQATKLTGSFLNSVPDQQVGFTGLNPTMLIQVSGGSKLANALSQFGDSISIGGTILNMSATSTSSTASEDRRWDDWKLQEDLAEKEMEQLDKQIVAAEIRKAIAKKDLENTELQIEQSKEIYEWMTDKYTNEELYKWMVTQISKVYFQSYQLAYDCAKRAQRAFQYELVSEQTYIQYGYWNSLKKGLLAGEQLLFDLKRMEMAYYEQNKRQFEITKNISIAQLDPMAIVMLRETGECFIELPEAIYDLDYAGHYMRRIKSVSLTIPCIIGPYASLNCTLTLISNKYRKDNSIPSKYQEDLSTGSDLRFDYNKASIQSIATSSGQKDSGVFQLNFDEDRFLPFEGAGAISRWRIQLPSVFKAFDYRTINDVIFHLSYTAKDGGETLKSGANGVIEDTMEKMTLGSKNTGLTKMFSMKQDYSNEWYKFLNPSATQTGQSTEVNFDISRFPQMFQNRTIEINKIEMLMILYDTSNSDTTKIKLTSPGSTETPFELKKTAALKDQLYSSVLSLNESTGLWKMSIDESDIPSKLLIEQDSHKRLNSDLVCDLIFVLNYSLS